MNFLVLLFVFIFSASAFGLAIKPSPAVCQARKQVMAENFDLAKATCVTVRDSKNCQDFAKKLDEEDKAKVRTCSDKEITDYIRGDFLGDAALACASGVVEDIKSIGTSIGEGAAKLAIAWEKDTECNKSLDQKMSIIMSYNLDVPRLLQYKMPSREQLEKMPCSNINGMLQLHKRTTNTQEFRRLKDRYLSPTEREKLTPAEKELMEYNKKMTDDLTQRRQGDLAGIVEGLIEDMGLSLECYSPAEAWALRCEMASLVGGVAIPSLFAARAAKLSKLTKLRLGKIQEQLADLRNLSREERIKKATNEIASLNEAEKIKKLESELGRANKPFNSKESNAVEKAHQVGANKGEKYGSYSGDSLREKKRILMQEGGFSEVEADFMINRGYVGFAGAEIKGSVRLNTANMIKDPRDRKLADEYLSQNTVTGQDVAAEKLSGHVGIKNGVSQNEEVRNLHRNVADSMSDDLRSRYPEDKVMKTSHKDAKNAVQHAEGYILDPEKPFVNEGQTHWNRYERNFRNRQDDYESVARNYIRAGDKEKAVEIMNKSPVMENLTTETAKRNYLNMILKKLEVNVGSR